jgi:hypothetical protein
MRNDDVALRMRTLGAEVTITGTRRATRGLVGRGRFPSPAAPKASRYEATRESAVAAVEISKLPVRIKNDLARLGDAGSKEGGKRNA